MVLRIRCNQDLGGEGATVDLGDEGATVDLGDEGATVDLRRRCNRDLREDAPVTLEPGATVT